MPTDQLPAVREGRETLCVAVLGTGSAGLGHLKALSTLEAVRPLAIPVRRGRVAELRSAGHDAVDEFEGARRLGARLCIIATETARHAADASLALRAGCDVLVEKPLGVVAAEAREVCRQASRVGHMVSVGCVLRFSESLNAFRASLSALGALHAVRIECQSYLPDWRPHRPYRDSYSSRAGNGGVLRDLIHEIDYAGWLYGWPQALHASVRNLGRLGIESEEGADLLWTTPAGCAVSVSLDYLSRPARRRMRASGEHGTLEWDGVEGTVTLALAHAPVRVTRFSRTGNQMFVEQARAFVNASRGCVDPRAATAEDGVRALAVCDAARRSSARACQEPVVDS